MPKASQQKQIISDLGLFVLLQLTEPDEAKLCISASDCWLVLSILDIVPLLPFRIQTLFGTHFLKILEYVSVADQVAVGFSVKLCKQI